MSFVQRIDHFCNTYGQDPALARELLLQWAEATCQDRIANFDEFMGKVVAQITAPATPPLEPAPPETQVDVERFFDASLTENLRAQCRKPKIAPTDGGPFCLLIPHDEWLWAVSLLQAGVNYAEANADGGFVIGWKASLTYGEYVHEILFCVFNSETGPFVEAWVQLAEGAFPGERNPTVQPRRVLDQVFDFKFPDNSTLQVILKEET